MNLSILLRLFQWQKLIGLFGLLLCSVIAVIPIAQAGPPNANAVQTCRIKSVSNEVLCGSIKRPLVPRGVPSSEGASASTVDLEIHFVVFPSLSRVAGGAPIFFLAGGPGQSAIELSAAMQGFFSRLNQRRDIVFVDQRGTGKSAPLDCKQAPERLSIQASLDFDRQIGLIRECLKKWALLPYGKPEQLTHFTTIEAMQDLEAVRIALGYQKIDLVGGSYGTRAALEYLRQFPQTTGRVVIDGVAPSDMGLPTSGTVSANAALNLLLEHCAQEATCMQRYPDLKTTWNQLLSSLPKTYQSQNLLTRELESVRIEQSHILNLVRQALYAPGLSRGLPFAIKAASSGRLEPLLALSANMSGGQTTQFSWGMHFAVVCVEDMPKTDPAKAQSDVFGRLYSDVCRSFSSRLLPSEFYEVKPSPVPVLVLSGGSDPVTPPIYGERVAKALGARALHVVAPNLSHGLIGQGCAPDLVHRFLTTKSDLEAIKLETDCLTKIPAPPAFVPYALRGKS